MTRPTITKNTIAKEETMERFLDRFTKLFWRKPPKIVGECWYWTRYKNPWNGYGQVFLKFDSKTYSAKAHRLSYRIHHGPIPAGASIMHTCDTPCCYNPKHLRAGTHAENMAERVMKGRSPAGAEHPHVKTTPAMAMEAKERRARGENNETIARALGLHVGTIRMMCNNRHWTTRHMRVVAEQEVGQE